MPLFLRDSRAAWAFYGHACRAQGPAEAEQAAAAADAPAPEVHDGWDFDCDWDGPLIAPNGAGPAAAPQHPQEPDDAKSNLQSPAAAPDQAEAMDQHWVGLGAQPPLPAPAAAAVEGASAEPSAAAMAADGGRDCRGGAGGGVTSITADSTWEEVQRVLGDGGRATIHSRGFAQNPFGPTLVRGYRGVAFEALKDGRLASLTLFQA